MDHTLLTYTSIITIRRKTKRTSSFTYMCTFHDFTQWTLTDQTAYSYYKFQRGKKVYIRNVIITALLTIHHVYQWRTEEFCSEGGSTNSVEDRGQGSGGR